MEELSRQDLSARLDRLESSIRRDRTVALAVIGLLFATAQATAPAQPANAPIVVSDATGASATLSANGLTIRDAQGKVRTFAGIDDSGYPSLDLHDASGALRESVYLLKDNPQFRQFDKSATPRAQLWLDSSENGELALSDANGKIRAAMFRTSKGDPQLGLYGSDEKLRAYFSTDDDSPYLVMRDAAGNTRLYAGGYVDGSIGMDIRNAQNGVLWKAP